MRTIEIHVEPQAPDRAIMALLSQVADALTAEVGGDAVAQGPGDLIPVAAEGTTPGDLSRLAVERMVEVEDQYGMTLAGWEHGGFVRTDTTFRTWGYAVVTQPSAKRRPTQIDITRVDVEEMANQNQWRIALEAVIAG